MLLWGKWILGWLEVWCFFFSVLVMVFGCNALSNCAVILVCVKALCEPYFPILLLFVALNDSLQKDLLQGRVASLCVWMLFLLASLC